MSCAGSTVGAEFFPSPEASDELVLVDSVAGDVVAESKGGVSLAGEVAVGEMGGVMTKRDELPEAGVMPEEERPCILTRTVANKEP